MRKRFDFGYAGTDGNLGCKIDMVGHSEKEFWEFDTAKEIMDGLKYVWVIIIDYIE
jgi:hypothetical protein